MMGVAAVSKSLKICFATVKGGERQSSMPVVDAKMWTPHDAKVKPPSVSMAL
jgi:hypothetical protein